MATGYITHFIYDNTTKFNFKLKKRMDEVFRKDAKCFDIPSDIVLEASEFSTECKLWLEVCKVKELKDTRRV